MAAGNRFNSFIEYVNEKAVNWQTDTFVIALTNSAPSSSNSVLADIYATVWVIARYATTQPVEWAAPL